jgi:hypothetical protein
MYVRELIAFLQKEDKDATVHIDMDGEHYHVDEVDHDEEVGLVTIAVGEDI